MNKTCLALLVCTMVFHSRSDGAEKPVQFPTGDAEWTIEMTYPGPVSTALRINKVVVTQIGNYRRSSFSWSNGKTTESWSVKGANLYAVENAQNGSIYVFPANDKFQTTLLMVNLDASSFDWVKKDLLKDTVTYHGRKCFHYEGMVSPGDDEGIVNGQQVTNPLAKVLHQAWIDSETLLPVALDDTLRSAAFTFQTPSGPLMPGGRILDAINRYQKAVTLPKTYNQN